MKKLLLLIVIVFLFSSCISTGLYGKKIQHPKNINNKVVNSNGFYK